MASALDNAIKCLKEAKKETNLERIRYLLKVAENEIKKAIEAAKSDSN